jgi:hypothetical protein
MRKFLLLIVLLVCIPITSQLDAQPCSGGAIITLTSQADIDNFQATYGPCDQVTGDLKILDGGDVTTDITNLNGLSGLTQINETLAVGPSSGSEAGMGNPLLSDISGLANLTSVGGLYVWENSSLLNLDDLSGLVFSGPASNRSLLVIDNSNLQNINGLSGISGQIRSLSIRENPLLTEIDALQNITSVQLGIGIANNTSLENIDGLAQITSARNIDIQNNPSLISVAGLQSLQVLTGVGGGTFGFVFINNDAITNLDGLSNLTIVQDLLLIRGNNELQNINGLNVLLQVDRDVEIILNPKLNTCNALYSLLDNVDDGAAGPGIAPVPDVGGTIDISSNAVGCNSPAEILAQGPYVAPVPTMGQWAFFLFGVIVFGLALVGVYNIYTLKRDFQ